MTNGCRPALRRGLSGQSHGVQKLIQEQLGRLAPDNVDEGQTEPAVFKCYFELGADHLADKLRRTFSDLLEIALAQRAKITLAPVEWAALQARVLVADESYAVSLWLKSTCGDSLLPPLEDLYWNNWRAPKWIFMEPFGNNPYDRLTAWEKMDEAYSKHVLERIEDLFNQRLIFGLEKRVGEAQIELAKRTDVVPKAALDGRRSSANDDTRSRSLKLFGRRQPDVAKRRAIVKNNPNMEGLGLCALFEAEKIPLPKQMQEAETWTKAWRTPALKHALESLISRDRKSE